MKLLKAPSSGKYTYCFSNEKSGRVDLDVSFNIHGVVYVDVNDPKLDSLEYAIQRLNQLTEDVKAEQGYLVLRERTHRNTAESTNSRVKWWSVFQILLLPLTPSFKSITYVDSLKFNLLYNSFDTFSLFFFFFCIYFSYIE